MTDANVAMYELRDYRTLSIRQQAALLGSHREDLACLVAPCVIEEQVRDGTGVMVAERDALVFVNPETRDGAAVRDVYIAYVPSGPACAARASVGRYSTPSARASPTRR